MAFTEDSFGVDSYVNARLRAAAQMVAARFSFEDENEPLVCADVGADHAYLSAYLVLHGICKRVYATEINELPAKKAVKNISMQPDVRVQTADGNFDRVPLSSLISVHVTDGLCGMQNKGINRAVICGMGGEVISGIIDRAEFVRNDKVKLVLQPMSKEMELREYLCNNGFYISQEMLVRDSGRVYTVMSAYYSGNNEALTPAELMLGKSIIQLFTTENGIKNTTVDERKMFAELIERKIGHAKNKMKSNNVSEDDRLLHDGLFEASEKFRTLTNA